MIKFDCDYLEGCHPAILDLLIKTNFEQTDGYGCDKYCEKARKLILEACGFAGKRGKNVPEVHFLVGGTQTNTTVIASILRPHQGVISAVTGHINVHETGAIESTGHKVMALPSQDGKLTAKQVEKHIKSCVNDCNYEHIVQPGMVYISFPTENGTIYSKSELSAIYDVCRKYGLPLFIDGARLGYGLAAEENDLTLSEIASLCDIFYIGGTKTGALFGEAVVITNNAFKKDFRCMIKQRGGMLAKGRLLGIQFVALFTDGLYFKLARHAVDTAEKIKTALEAKGVKFLFDSPTNQIFPIFPDEILEKLSKKFSFSFWEKTDERHTAVRICTSWATKDEDIEKLIDFFNRI
ncbi:low specificity L-threonine aldolase [bacterium]|nr:low specificity L-threonine aldolase [bacterium]